MSSSPQFTRKAFLQATASATAVALLPRFARGSGSASEPVDVCIYGGTSAGVVAAIQIARLGRSVLLLEPGRHVGGMSVEGLASTDIDNHAEYQNSPAIGGLALEFYRRLATHYGRRSEFDEMIRTRGKNGDAWKFEPHVAESVFNRWLAEHKVPVRFEHRLAEADGVVRDGRRIAEIRCENGRRIRARVFLDCTYEGDLLAAAGLSCAVGREGNARYGETKNGIRTLTTHKQIDLPIDPYRVPGDARSGTIFGVSDEPIGEHGAPSDAIQGYSFRLCLTRVAANQRPITRPESYNAAHYELQRRYFAAGGEILPHTRELPNGKIEPGSWHTLCGFLTGWNHHWNSASYAERARLLRNSREYVQGLYWYLQNDPAVPVAVRRAWQPWALCRDEFTDNANWPRMFYPRNGRRLVGDFVMTEAHGRMANPVPVTDPVGMNWWPHDLHSARRIVRDGKVWNEGAVFNERQDWMPWGLSFQSLVPKAAECVNLLSPTCPSMSYVAYGSFRNEYGFMIAAHSAATAAVLAVARRCEVQAVPYAELRTRLLEDGQVLAVPANRAVTSTRPTAPVCGAV